MAGVTLLLPVIGHKQRRPSDGDGHQLFTPTFQNYQSQLWPARLVALFNS